MAEPRHNGRGKGLVYALRYAKIQPGAHSLLAYTADEEEPRKVEIPDIPQRWKRVMLVLDEIHWVRVEVINKKSEIVFTYKRGPDDERAAGEIEDLTPLGGTGAAGNMNAVLGTACHWLLRAQDVALQRHESSTQQLLEAHTRMMDATERRYALLDRNYNDLMRVNHAMHGETMAQQVKQLRAAVEKVGLVGDDGGPISDAMMGELLPQILEAVLRKSDAAPAAKPGANGHAKKTAAT